MKSSNLKIILLAILSSVVAFCIVLMLIYLLATASNNTKKNNANAAVQSQTSTSGAQNQQSDNTKKSTEANAQVSAEGCTLYYVNQDTDFFTADMLRDDHDAAEKEAAEMESNTIGGLYTGTESATYAGYIELNYLDGTVLVPSTDVMPVSSNVILPLGSISQIIQTGAEYDYETGDEMPQFTGYSGCGPACLYMLATSIGAELNPTTAAESPITSYEELLDYASAYADQGDMSTDDGGMTSGSLCALARDVYALNLVNKYDAEQSPSAVVKSILDEGKQAIVLVNHENGRVVDKNANEHFILVTEYSTAADGTLRFVYANSYYYGDYSVGEPLMTLSADMLDSSASLEFSEPNAILCVE